MKDQTVETDALSNIIRQLLKSLNLTNAIGSINLNSSTGVNYTGEVKEIEIIGKDENAEMIKFNLFAKIAPKEPVRRTIYSIEQVYKREIYIYENVLPQFAKLQKICNIETPFVSIPKYYLSSSKALDEIIILENMNVLGYKKYNAHNTFDYNHALLVIEELGKFHAFSFVLREKNPKLFRKITGKMHDIEMSTGYLLEVVSNWLIEILNVFDAKNERVVQDKIERFRKNLDQIMKKAVVVDGIEEHAVIGHCDFWTSNMLFKYEKSSFIPTDVCIVDWQMAKICSPVHDLSQFMFSCCDKKLRDEYYTHLIEEYYRSFSSLLVRFGEDPAQLFPYAALQHHLKKYSVYGLLSAIKVTYLLSVCTPDLSSITSLTDIINKFMAAEKDPSVFNVRLKDIILDYISYGYDM